MLSLSERQVMRPGYSPNEFKKILNQLMKYGVEKDLHFRPVLVFGDLMALPYNELESYFLLFDDVQMAFALTMTLANDSLHDHYKESLCHLMQRKNRPLIDITIDPIRLENNVNYAERLRWVIQNGMDNLHLQSLLSSSVIAKYSPKNLSDLLIKQLGETIYVSLGFMPTLKNLEKPRYGYEVTTAAEYAQSFYQQTALGQQHLINEINRFTAVEDDDCCSFMSQAFHVGQHFNVFPVSYTIYGDLVFDHRNKQPSLGDLQTNSFSEILQPKQLQKHKMLNHSGLLSGKFGCHDCDYLKQCSYHGVGLARRIYQGQEQRLGGCYGVKSFVNFR